MDTDWKNSRNQENLNSLNLLMVQKTLRPSVFAAKKEHRLEKFEKSRNLTT